mmetsp:Transcript_9447/g.19256  ORF Transcript_9447/g.19256 Transcript_9447/m.19256 type:complete len:179 (+) Transcript_9447:873-1409(+)
MLAEWLGVRTPAHALAQPTFRATVRSWYDDARRAAARRAGGPLQAALSCPADFRTDVWPAPLHDGTPSTDVPAVCPPAPSGAGAPRRSVPLIGRRPAPAARPHLRELPTSYTDFYAELSRLSPHTEQTAMCLLCSAALNASEQGECTRHAAWCGAGSGLFWAHCAREPGGVCAQSLHG